MASIAISSATPSSPVQADPTAKAAQPETASKTAAVLKPDTVKLSTAAQVKMMHRAGQSPALIAATLGTNVASVNGYLGITVAKQAATTPMPAATPQAPSAVPSAQPETGKTASAPPAPARSAPALPVSSGKS